jgi:hypothetical protein
LNRASVERQCGFKKNNDVNIIEGVFKKPTNFQTIYLQAQSSGTTKHPEANFILLLLRSYKGTRAWENKVVFSLLVGVASNLSYWEIFFIFFFFFGFNFFVRKSLFDTNPRHLVCFLYVCHTDMEGRFNCHLNTCFSR